MKRIGIITINDNNNYGNIAEMPQTPHTDTPTQSMKKPFGLFLPMPALPKWMQPELPALLQSLSVPSHSSPFLIRKTRETACISIAFRFVDSKEGNLKFPLLSLLFLQLAILFHIRSIMTW